MKAKEACGWRPRGCSRTVRDAPLVAVLVPVTNGLLLWGALAAGGAWLGWTA